MKRKTWLGIIGTGGHAKVIRDVFRSMNKQFKFVYFSAVLPEQGTFFDEKVYPDNPDLLLTYFPCIHRWHVAIGNQQARRKKTEFLSNHSKHIIPAVHRYSVVADSVRISEGAAVMAGAVINPDTYIGKGCIVNTSASIDHDCHIGDFVNIGPGCNLAGGVAVGEMTQLGTGTVIIPNVTIGRHCIAGAGSVIISDIEDYSVVVGVPARTVRKIIPTSGG
ncbi:MAG: acetyltransferase [Bacillota bacterium]|nr:acetyltransferase [Bacillota bacterium]MDW7684832.1 acetyltransferase [Bacillota bacterium]